MGPVVRLIGSGIGLASEALAHRKAKKAKEASSTSTDAAGESSLGVSRSTQNLGEGNHASESQRVIEVSDKQGSELLSNGQAVQLGYNDSPELDEAPPSYDEIVEDEEDWELDEAGDEKIDDRKRVESKDQDLTADKPDVRKILGKFLDRHSTGNNAVQSQSSLPCPVIIPQRRPRNRSRGFVKAYAPVLEGCGVDQETWMDFLETFDKASQASPIFGGIVIAASLVGFVPSVSAMVASTLVQAAATTAIVVQSRSRINTFLDDINEHFFRPRGLFVLLI